MTASSSKGSSRDAARFVSLFQKAHSNVASLQRIDDQIAGMFEQRRRSLEELRNVQAQINSEFERLQQLDRVLPADNLSQSESEEEESEEIQPIQVAKEVRSSTTPRVVSLNAMGS